MAGGITFQARVLGLAELDRALRELPRDLARNALAAATRAGANELLKAAQNAAPIRSDPRPKKIKPGRTRAGKAAQRRVARRIQRQGGGSVQLTRREAAAFQTDLGGATRGPGFLRKSIKIYSVRLDRAGSMTARIGIGQAFYGGFREFGTRRQSARPWFQAAVQGAAQAAVTAMGNRLRVEIEKAAAKYRARGA